MFDLGFSYPQLSQDAAAMFGAAAILAVIFSLIPITAYLVNRLCTVIHELGHVSAYF